jgi:hypothetical protein
MGGDVGNIENQTKPLDCLQGYYCKNVSAVEAYNGRN